MKRTSRSGGVATDALLAMLSGVAPIPPLSADFADQILRHRLAGLAIALDEGGGLRGGPLEGVYRRQAVETLEAVGTAHEVAEHLSSKGIQVLAFKGAGLHLAGAYPDPGVRPMGDIDLLVRPSDAAQAVQVLVSMGFMPWQVWGADRVAWSDSLALSGGTEGGSRVDIDLHWRTEYDRLRFGHGDSPLWEGAGSERYPAAAPHLLVIIEHMLKHLRRSPHLLGLLDTVRLVPMVDWSDFVRLARTRPLGSAVGLFLLGLSESLDLAIPPHVTSTLVPTGLWNRVRRRWISPESMARGGSSSALAGLATWTLLSESPAAAFGAARVAAFPDRQWLRARYGAGSPRFLGLRYLRDCAGWVMGGASPLER